MLDLDSIQYLAERVIPDSEVPARVWLARPVVLALVAELRAYRQALEAAGLIVEGLRPMHGRTAKAHSSPCAACRFVAAVDKLTEETTEPIRGGA